MKAMTITPDISGFFSGATGLGSLSPAYTENVETQGDASLSNTTIERLVLSGQAGLSNPIQDFTGNPVMILGVDLVTGQKRPFAPGDIIARSDGSAAFSTGISGTTGAIGYTGAAASGEIGTIGATGIAGSPGLDGSTGFRGIYGIQGATGIVGETGILGATGIQGNTGTSEEGLRVFGFTGIQGNTGIQGATGPVVQGETGILGEMFDQGATGIQGLTGLNSSVQGATGASGTPGSTGIAGETGISLRGNNQQLRTLNAETPAAASVTVSIAANALGSNEQYLKWIAFGSFTATSVLNTADVTFGSTSLLSLSNLNFDADSDFYAVGHIFRNTSSEALCFIDFVSGGEHKSVVRTVAAEDLTTDLDLTLELSSGTVDALVVRQSD